MAFICAALPCLIIGATAASRKASWAFLLEKTFFIAVLSAGNDRVARLPAFNVETVAVAGAVNIAAAREGKTVTTSGPYLFSVSANLFPFVKLAAYSASRFLVVCTRELSAEMGSWKDLSNPSNFQLSWLKSPRSQSIAAVMLPTKLPAPCSAMAKANLR